MVQVFLVCVVVIFWDDGHQIEYRHGNVSDPHEDGWFDAFS